MPPCPLVSLVLSAAPTLLPYTLSIHLPGIPLPGRPPLHAVPYSSKGVAVEAAGARSDPSHPKGGIIDHSRRA